MRCLKKVFQTIEINCTWMFSTFYICVTSCFSMNIRYTVGSLPHNFTKSYKKFSIFIAQSSGTHKESYSKCNKKNWIYGKRKAYIQTKMDKKSSPSSWYIYWNRYLVSIDPGSSFIVFSISYSLFISYENRYLTNFTKSCISWFSGNVLFVIKRMWISINGINAITICWV